MKEQENTVPTVEKNKRKWYTIYYSDRKFSEAIELLQFINSDQKKIMDSIHLMMLFRLESIMDFQLRSVIYYKRRVI